MSVLPLSAGLRSPRRASSRPKRWKSPWLMTSRDLAKFSRQPEFKKKEGPNLLFFPKLVFEIILFGLLSKHGRKWQLHYKSVFFFVLEINIILTPNKKKREFSIVLKRYNISRITRVWVSLILLKESGILLFWCILSIHFAITTSYFHNVLNSF